MIIIYSYRNSKRLQYILGLVFKELLKVSFNYTTNIEEYKAFDGPKLHYANTPLDDSIFICSKNILFETDIRHQEIQFVDFQGITCPFSSYNKQAILPFDVFGASFYLLSRYEEYLPHKKDAHKRFKAEESLSFQKDFLHIPVINKWVKELGKRIQQRHPQFIPAPPKYNFTPTYDIDIAWAYKYKGLTRNMGGVFRDLFQLNFKAVKKRYQVLYDHRKDPFDTYAIQKQWQKKYKLNPIYFILFGDLSPFDKNISCLNSHFKSLVKGLRDQAIIGIHPSYISNNDIKILKKEISDLADTVHVDIIRSRQHFLKLNLPSTYRNLINLGIKHDYSMGYASQVGFRAGIASSFNFYDLDLDTETKLRIHPFAVMDGTLKDYLNINPKEAKKVISQLIDEVKKVNGEMISLWHNESLSNEERWKGWLEVYEHLLQEAQAQ